MAKLSKGIFGPVSGKIGSVVGSTWKNIACVRSLPQKKNSPQTPAQIANQQKFKFVNDWLVPFYPYVSTGFKNLARSKTEINAAFSLNYRNAVLGAYPDLSIDYTKVMLSTGKLPGLFNAQITRPNPESIMLTWLKDDFLRETSFDDQVMLVLYNPELKIADGFIGGVKRADQKCTFRINPRLIGKPLEVYLSTYTLNRKAFSDSKYIGRVGA